MKKRNVVLQAAVAAALFSTFGVANAGTISIPAADSAATKYATEALISTTVVAIPAVTYTMGVTRTAAQDFTMIFTPSTGATFVPANCVGANFLVAGAGAATISTKRASATECAIEVDVTTDFTTATTIRTSGVAAALALATHPLAVAGSTVAITVSLRDLGETAFIDNSGTLSRTVATSVNAINVYASTSDTLTTADVNASAGPLKGFLSNATAPSDSSTIAQANLTFDNNTVSAQDATGAALFNFAATGGTLSLTLTDANKSFGALTPAKLCIDLDSDAVLCEAGEFFGTPVGNAATLAAIPSTTFPGVGTAATRTVSFQNNGADLGTARTIAVTGTITPAVGAAHALADTTSKNATYWVWTANAIELWAPYFSTAPGYISRFSFQNTGIAVGYTTTCQAEVGNTAIVGTAASGTLNAGMTIIPAGDVCTFSGAARGVIRFVINAPAGNIHATYNVVHQASGAFTSADLTRPFATATH